MATITAIILLTMLAIANALDHLEPNDVQKQKIKNNLEKLNTRYNWDIVADQYEVVFQQALIR